MRFLSFLACLLGASAVVADLVLVESGKPKAAIVIHDQASLPERFAAEQLGYWVEQLTGARLPNVKVMDGDMNAVYIGRIFAEEHYGDDLQRLRDSQGFAVRATGKGLYLFGDQPVGAVFAVFDLLEKNSDIIWPSMAKEVDRVFTRTDKLVIRKVNYWERPVFHNREWGINNGYYYNHPRTEYFCVRLKTDGANAVESPNRRFGFSNANYTCHNLHRYLPWDSYHQKHPEYFCLIDGVRQKPGYHGNLCFTAPGGAEEYARNFIRDCIEHGPDCDGMAGIGVEDSNATCQCKACMEPITLPDGRVITYKDHQKEFLSCRYYLWLNRVMEVIHKKHPTFKVNTVAYMFAETPPPIPLHKNIVINFCPIGNNLKQDLLGDTNRKVWKTMQEWSRRCKQLSVYEYYGCAADYPRPVSYVIQKNLQLMRRLNIRRIYSEWIHKKGAEYMSAMEFWIACKLLWNPDLDIERLRQEYLTRTFRGAARHMKRFYDIIRDTWYADGASSYYYDNAIKSTMYYLLKDKNVERECRTALKSAVASADHPASRRFAKKILDIFENYVKEAKKIMVKTGDIIIPRIADASLASMEGGAWANAVQVTEFFDLMRPKKKTGVSLEVRVAHDGQNLMFKFHADHVTFPMALPASMFSREHWEIFLQTDNENAAIPYYHVAFDTQGNKYNAIGFGIKWDFNWSVSVRQGDTSWDALVRLPLKGLSIKNNKARMHFLHYSLQRRKNDTWWGGAVHEPGAMTTITLAK